MIYISDIDFYDFLIDKALETKDYKWLQELQNQKENYELECNIKQHNKNKLVQNLKELEQYEVYLNLKNRLQNLTREDKLKVIQEMVGLKDLHAVMYIIETI